MRAAEKLIAQRGMENVSIRDIVSEAGQKNESALQYHFKSFTGLIQEILSLRSKQLHEKRAELLSTVLAADNAPSLRQICVLMVRPAFELARTDANFRRYIKAFGHELVLTETSPLSTVAKHGGGGASGAQVGQLLIQALPHLDKSTFQARLEAAVRLISASMYHQARQKNAFRGHQSDVFFHHLIDAVTGLLNAPISAETQALQKP